MTTNQQHQPISNLGVPAKLALSLIINVAVSVLVWWLSVRGQLAPAIFIVLLVELWPAHNTPSWKLAGPRATQIVMGISASLLIALLPKFIAQVVVAGLYLTWRLLEKYWRYDGRAGLLKLFVVQIVSLEACFLLAAVWRAPSLLVLMLVWLSGTAVVWQALKERCEPSAGIFWSGWLVISSPATI